MNKLTGTIAKTPLIGRALLVLYRARMVLGRFGRPFLDSLKWLFNSRETTNFTYDLEETNKRYLAALIADVTNAPFDEIMGYIREVEEDGALRGHITEATGNSDFAFVADREVRFGRRVGWYALARALKPGTIIETGVDKGLGACVLTAALRRTREEGSEGRYYGTDINPDAGYLLSGEYASYGQILYGDSIQSLQKFDGVLDLFINDSDHSADYEADEYATIADKLSDRAIILGDNSHCNDRLLEFSLNTGRHFVFFQEKPRDHWYPGAGIGISFKRQANAQ